MSMGRTSLQRLQSLEKDFNNLEEQLRELRSITQLDISVQSKLSGPQESRACRYHGKQEWAIKWLLKKLQEPEEPGTAARLSSKLWATLADLIYVVPPPLSAKFLTGHQFLDGLQKTLQESFGEHSYDLVSKSGQTKDQDVTMPVAANFDDTKADSGAEALASAKRKRKHDAAPQARPKRQKSSTAVVTKSETHRPSPAFRIHLFNAVARSLQNVLQLSNGFGSKNSDILSGNADPIFRTDHVQAAKILGSWLSALACVEPKTSLAERTSDLFEDGFAAVLRIWGKRSDNSSGETVWSSLSFAQHCLVPAVILLKDDSISVTNKTTVEQLVAKHIFLAAKSIFIGTSQRQNSSAGQPSPDASSGLSELLQPLRHLIQERRSGQSSEETSLSSLLDTSIPVLFSIAVRCTPLNSPRRRLRERPWFEYVLVELSSCLGLDMKEHDRPVVGGQDLMRFTEMLRIAKLNKLRFSDAIMQKIAADYCDLGSSTSKDKPPNWTAIAHIIALDANTFLRKTKTARFDAAADDQTLDELLTAAISDHAFIDDELKLKETVTIRDYEVLRDEVVIALLRAYANARDTAGFLKHWRRGVERFDDKEDDSRSISIWEDSDLQVALAEVLESSMTSSQISEVVNELSADLHMNEETAFSYAEFQRASASAVLLTAVLNGIQSDETKATVLSRASSLPLQALAMLKARKGTSSVQKSRLWRLVASVHRLWASISKPEEFLRASLDTESLAETISLCIRHRKEGLPSDGVRYVLEFRERLEALACIGSILNDLQSRQWTSDQIKRTSASLLESFMEEFKARPLQSAEIAHRFGLVIAQYPTLLLLESESNGKLKDEVLSAIAVSDKLNRDIDAIGSSPWSNLIRRSVQDSTWLLDEMIKIVPRLERSLMWVNLSGTDQINAVSMTEISYLQIPSSTFPRSERKKILNDLTEAIRKSGPTFQARDWYQKLSFMLHIMSVIPGEAGLGIPFADILMVADTLDTSFVSNKPLNQVLEDILAIFKEFAGLSLRHDLQVAGKKHAETLLLKLIEDSMEAGDLNSRRICRLAILSTLLDLVPLAFDPNQAEPGNVIGQIQANICSPLCELVNQTWASVESLGADKSSRARLLQQLVEVLAKLHHEALRAHQFAIHGVRTIVDRALEQIEGDTSLLAILSYKLAWKVDAQDPEALEFDTAFDILQEGLRPSAQVHLQEFLIEAFALLSEQQRADKLRDLIDECQNASTSKSANRWQVLNMLVSANPKLKPKAHQDIIPASETSSILITLASSLPKISTIREYHFIASSMTIILRHSAKPITQPAIEAILMSIVSVLSPTSNAAASISPKHGPRIFASQAGILRILLTQHRRQLRGRFDLLIPALQSLLHRLFILPGSPARSVWPLAARHADAYTRLVTLLCDPSASSTASARHAFRHLTDETRKARTYAGQYVPALLLTLCDLQLRGRFAGEGVREALAQGVFVMFDVMGKDVLGATNEGVGMPSGVRTVLRQWWEAWRLERR